MSERFDIVVVGGGGSGLAAAAAAAAAGARVCVLEKADRIGGTTALSVGSFTAAGTFLQRQAGIADSAEAHFADLDRFPRTQGAQDNLELRRLFVDNAAATLEWLASLGVMFHGPSLEPPHARPRLHLALPHSGAYLHALSRAARSHGAQLRPRHRVTRLLVEGERVAGVEASGPGGAAVLRAEKGVVLATGDYAAGKPLLREFAGEHYAHLEPINPANTGDGVQLARVLGARVLNGAAIFAERRFAVAPRSNWLKRLPPTAALGRAVRFAMRRLPRPLLQPVYAMYLTVNMAPSAQLFEAGARLLRGKEGDYVVFDAAVAHRFEQWPNFVSTAPGVAYAYLSDYRRYRPDIFHRADSAGELAARLGIGPEAAKLSGEAPWYALGPLYERIMTTDGGLAISGRFEVLRGAQPIRGLYAVGSAGQGGVQLPGHGQHLGWAFTSGRLCGLQLAKA